MLPNSGVTGAVRRVVSESPQPGPGALRASVSPALLQGPGLSGTGFAGDTALISLGCGLVYIRAPQGSLLCVPPAPLYPLPLNLPVMRHAGMAMPGHTVATPFCCCDFLIVPLSHISCYPKMDFELFFPNMFKHLYKSLGFPACGHHGSCRLGLGGKFLVGGVHFGVALCSMPSLPSHHLIHLHNPSWRYRRSSTDTLGDLGFFPQISFPPLLC